MTDLLTNVGRMVGGSLYNPITTDREGNPLIIKTGNNKGNPREDYYFATAIPKGTEKHWAETTWGQIIWGEGHAALPALASTADFKWKIIDGDGVATDMKGNLYSAREGYSGHWVLSFSSGFAPKIVGEGGLKQLIERDAIMPGYYIEVFGSVASNGKNGVYLNHSVVNLVQVSERIMSGGGVDPATVGFGGVAPANAIPAAVQTNFSPAVPAAPVEPASIPAPVTPSAPVTHVTPNPAILQPPVPPQQ